MACEHMDQIQDVSPQTEGCGECVTSGDRWVALRMCLTCGEVGCCDSSVNRHATAHFAQTGHAIMEAVGEGSWKFCYIDKAMV